MTFINYIVKKHIFSLAQNYTITDQEGYKIAHVKSPKFTLPHKGVFYDDMDNEVFTIRTKLFSFKRTYYLEKNDKAIFKVFKPWGFKPTVFVESLLDPDAFVIQGNFWSNEYAFYKNDIEFAYVTSSVINISGQYQVSIETNENQQLVLALVVILDMLRKRKNN